MCFVSVPRHDPMDGTLLVFPVSFGDTGAREAQVFTSYYNATTNVKPLTKQIFKGGAKRNECGSMEGKNRFNGTIKLYMSLLVTKLTNLITSSSFSTSE